MTKLLRSLENPILIPSKVNNWEAHSVFNGCVVLEKNIYHLLYRAISSPQVYFGINMNLSTIGHAIAIDGTYFTKREQFIKPEYDWEKYGCEDPRVTKFEGKYYIFYTALSAYPFMPAGIKIGLAVTSDFKKIDQKHQVTSFNSKAMALFPERINGKIAAVLTAHVDMPPAKICLALFDKEEQIWSKDYWDNWYKTLDTHVIPLQRNINDQVEVGASPLKTEYGWLLIYCHIQNYLSQRRIFGIEVALLDLKNPLKVLGFTKEPLLVPEKDYELHGNVPNVIFPSGAIVDNGKLDIYYGAADTTVSLASCKLNELIKELLLEREEHHRIRINLERFSDNPIITPKPEHPWESKYTFNSAAIYENGKAHLIYRAMGDDLTSVLGYASSNDGFHIDERLTSPIYIPREDFERKIQPGNSGCEDPRITKIDDKFYMCYTAYDGKNPTRVALTSIRVDDFLNKQWRWTKPVLISPPGVDDKNACILSKKIDGKYVIFHRLSGSIWIDFVDDLGFDGTKWIEGKVLFGPRINRWDNEKIGIGGPPIETKYGWLLIYHGLSRDTKYRLGMALLDLNNPAQVIARLTYPILSPEAEYENKGLRFGTIFTCGAVIVNDKLFVYYGGADQVVCLATTDLNDVLEKITMEMASKQ